MTKVERFDKRKVAQSLSDIWDVLTDEERNYLCDNVRVERFKKNEVIYHEGDQPDNLLCLLSGKVKIYREGLGGRCLTNRVLRSVQYFGYRASMAGETYVTSASAFDESTIVVVPMRAMYHLMQQNTGLCHFVYNYYGTS